MELPLGGPALRHYTQSRPRPHRQKLNYRPSRPQETIIESDNEVLELMGRVDEGVEEFFTKRVLPTDTPKKQEEEAIKVQEVAPASSVPCPPPTKTLRRKLGDFFTLKKRRGLKSETSQEGRPKKASIADLIRPLREVTRAEKDKDRVKEHDKENEKEKTKDAITGESAVQETPGAALRGEVVPPRRALREGKSQSLILLSGSAAAGTTNARNTSKKQFEGQHSFEQKLHLMLQRIGVSKAQPEEPQNQEGEMKKAESEGTIIDSKPEPPPTFTKPRTMSASSDTRHHIRPSVSAHEAAGKPALLPKPMIKPGPPTTSGRNTPENELAQIQEGEATTPTKPSPTTAPSTPPAHTSTTTITTTPTVPTISDSAPDSSDSTSTVPDTDSSNNPERPKSNATTTETPASTSLTTPASTTTVSVTSPSSVSITPVTSDSTPPTTTSLPSIITAETVSVPTTESSKAPTNMSTSPNLEPTVDATPAAGVDAAIAVATAASPPSTSMSDTPPGSSTATSLVPETSDDSSAKSVGLSVAKTLSSPSDSSQTITAAASSPVTSVTSTSTSTSISVPSAIPTTTPISSTTTTISPTSTDSVLTPTTTPPASASPDITIPSTSSSETNPTGTTSTATSLNRADTTSTSSSANAAAICSPLMTESVPPDTDNLRTSVTPTTDPSSATSDHLTKPAASDDGPGRDDAPQMSTEQKSTVECRDETTDEEKVQNSEQTETDESQKVADGGKDGDNEKEKAARTSDSEVIMKEVQEESVKPDEGAMKSQAGMAEPASGEQDDELSSNKVATESQKQDEGEK